MKNLNRWLTVAGMTLLIGSASAQNPAYSSKAGWLRTKVEKDVAASAAVASAENASDAISSKPWLYPHRLAGKERVMASAELKSVSADNYNTKRAARGERGVEFELAPLK